VRDKRPLQIYLDRHQCAILKALAEIKGLSMSELVRESIAKYLAECPIESDPAMKLVGLGNSGKGDLAAKHDEYLVEAYKAEVASKAPPHAHKSGQ